MRATIGLVLCWGGIAAAILVPWWLAPVAVYASFQGGKLLVDAMYGE